MIKLVEHRATLLEKKLDDILTTYTSGYGNETIAEALSRYPYYVDIERSNLIEVNPSDVSPKDDVLFIFKKVKTDKWNGELNNAVYYYQVFANKQKSGGLFMKAGEFETASGERVALGNKELGAASMSWCKTNCFKAFKFEPLVLNKDLQIKRASDRDGMVKRYKDYTFDNPYGGKSTLSRNVDKKEDILTGWGTELDKSGYIMDPDKYRKMLATVNKEAYVKYFEKALDLVKRIDSLAAHEYDLEGDYGLNAFDYSKLVTYKKSIVSPLGSFARAFRSNNKDTLVYYANDIKKRIPEWESKVAEIEDKLKH